ncbi:unnamed protein product, partial [Prorocentrum cordatum]
PSLLPLPSSSFLNPAALPGLAAAPPVRAGAEQRRLASGAAGPQRRPRAASFAAILRTLDPRRGEPRSRRRPSAASSCRARLRARRLSAQGLAVYDTDVQEFFCDGPGKCLVHTPPFVDSVLCGA